MSLAAPPLTAVQKLVENLNAENLRTEATLDNTFDLVLEQDGRIPAISSWRATGLQTESRGIAEIGAGAIASSYLILRRAKGACVDRCELIAGYPGMVTGAPPAPVDPVPLQSYKQETKTVNLAIGYSFNGEEGLGNIVYSLKQA